MRPSLASSIGVACAAALAASTALTAHADDHRPRATAPGPRDHAAPVPGSTHTIALTGVTPARGTATRKGEEGVTVRGLAPRRVSRFSLIGVTWDSVTAQPPTAVRVRTRSAATGTWSPWRNLPVNDDDTPDIGSAEAGPAARGSTTPLWVGRSNGVEVRADAHGTATRGLGTGLPEGLRVELVDPGRPGDDGGSATATSDGAVAIAGDDTGDDAAYDSGGGAEDEPTTEAPAEDAGHTSPGSAQATRHHGDQDPGDQDPGDTEDQTPETGGRPAADSDVAPRGTAEIPEGTSAPDATASRYSAPRPRIVTRAGWGADEGLREPEFKYTGKVRTAFVHHSDTGNNYTCAEAPAVIRSIYRYHVKSSGWRDIGYNFLVDKCGTIYEGRAGGVTKPVMGAHTLGFNRNSTGIAVIGSFGSHTPPKAATTALARLTAWKLGLSGVDAAGSSTVVSGGGKYKAGVKVRMKAISGHRDGYNTSCPGARLYAKLGSVRKAAAALQRR
jgi:N-acetylmuramoyl-L-alanine amidase